MSPERYRVIIILIQRDPRDGPFAAVDPLAQERGLAKTGWSANERQAMPQVQRIVEPLS
jgi:hypothetical protein